MERRAVRPSDHGTLRHCSYEDLLGSAVPPQQRRHFLSQLSASSLVVRKLGARGGGGLYLASHVGPPHYFQAGYEGWGEPSFSLFRMPGTVCTHWRSMMVTSVAMYYGRRVALLCVPPLGSL